MWSSTVGELNDPAALGAQPANVHIERWLPLAPLLPHATQSCATPDLEPPSPRSPAAFHSYSFPRVPTSSPTPTPANEPEWPAYCPRLRELASGT